ncbi:MAG: efflux RND transporter periplasmic adaptor subunit [Nitrosomonas sp.]|nr:efflux RND transporter periplasmic adaptor subunit [Nitrosomonas sp.]
MPRVVYKRRILRLIVAGMLFALIVFAWSWLRYQSQHVFSSNAVVRSQITEVGTRFNGMLATTEVSEGERVHAGQVLARLANQHISAEIQQIQAQIEALEREMALEQSAIEHERLKRKSQLQEANARVAAAHAESAAAKSRAEEAYAFYKARQSLLEKQLIPRDTMRQAEANHRTAAALESAVQANKTAAESARQNALLDFDSLDLRVQRLEVLDANLRAAKAQLERAQADLDGTLIRAPDDGTVIRQLIKTGGSVRVGMPVILMSIGDDVWIEAWIDEDQVHRVKTGDSVVVTLPSHPGRNFKGVVDAIGVATDFEQPVDAVPQPRATRMKGAPVISVQVRLESPPPSLLPGLSATVAILEKVN